MAPASVDNSTTGRNTRSRARQEAEEQRLTNGGAPTNMRAQDDNDPQMLPRGAPTAITALEPDVDTIDITNNANQNPTPAPSPAPMPWLKKKADGYLSIISTLTKKRLLKEDTIAKLEEGIQSGTAPKPLRVNVKAQVTPRHQVEVDQLVASAAKEFQMTVMTGLLKVRKDELSELLTEIEEATNALQEDKDRLTSRFTDREVTIPHHSIDVVMANFTIDIKALIEKTTSDHIVGQFVKEETAIKRREAAAVQAVDYELESPEFNALKKKFDTLTKTVATLQKKASAKSNQPRSDGGASNSGKKKSKGKANGKGAQQRQPSATNPPNKTKGGKKGNSSNRRRRNTDAAGEGRQ